MRKMKMMTLGANRLRIKHYINQHSGFDSEDGIVFVLRLALSQKPKAFSFKDHKTGAKGEKESMYRRYGYRARNSVAGTVDESLDQH